MFNLKKDITVDNHHDPSYGKTTYTKGVTRINYSIISLDTTSKTMHLEIRLYASDDINIRGMKSLTIDKSGVHMDGKRYDEMFNELQQHEEVNVFSMVLTDIVPVPDESGKAFLSKMPFLDGKLGDYIDFES